MARQYLFPDPSTADKDGLLAAGGDLSVESLVAAYTRGIFPWFSDTSPILWWCPDPRMVLFPEKIRVSKNLARKVKDARYEVRFDENFGEVIRLCAAMKRKGQKGTWITNEMKQAYMALHHEGFAHSVETYFEGKLAGGLYGVSLGRVFYGESMFHLMSDASKIALVRLASLLRQLGFAIIDAQQSTEHLRSLGAEEIPREKFLRIISEAMKSSTIKGSWSGFTGLLRDHMEDEEEKGNPGPLPDDTTRK